MKVDMRKERKRERVTNELLAQPLLPPSPLYLDSLQPLLCLCAPREIAVIAEPTTTFFPVALAGAGGQCEMKGNENAAKWNPQRRREPSASERPTQ